MKPDYKNWIPKGMLVSLIAGTALSLALLQRCADHCLRKAQSPGKNDRYRSLG